MTPGRLRFDSARTTATLGTRSPSPLARTLLFEAGDLSIDVMLQDGGADLRIIHGQVVRAAGTAVAGAVVRIGSEQVRTDEHGQFAVTLLAGRRPAHFTVHTPDDGSVTCAIPREETAGA